MKRNTRMKTEDEKMMKTRKETTMKRKLRGENTLKNWLLKGPMNTVLTLENLHTTTVVKPNNTLGEALTDRVDYTEFVEEGCPGEI